MTPELDLAIREVLNMVKGIPYVLTGSLALKLSGLLDREIHDLDLISDDPLILAKLSEQCMNMSDLISNPNHHRFSYGDDLFIDVFMVSDLKQVPQTPVKLWARKLVMTPPKYIYLKKLTELKDFDKIRGDLVEYFNRTLNY